MAKTLSGYFEKLSVGILAVTVQNIPHQSPDERIISLEEVSWHEHSKDCWIVIYDRVYDVTDFLNDHPGGDEILLEYAGRDATVAFRGSGHSKHAVKALERYFIGELPVEERIFRKPGGFRLSDIPK